MAHIPIEDCIRGHLYHIHSRNLTLAVYDGKGGFKGIREKWGSEYLFTEYHADQGHGCATVHPIKDYGPTPQYLEIKTSIGTHCGECFAPVQRGPSGWEHILFSRYEDETEERLPVEYNHDPVARDTPNRMLEAYLRERAQVLLEK